MKGKSLKYFVCTIALTVALISGFGINDANALVFDIVPVENAINEAVAAGVDQESAILNSVRDFADKIHAEQVAADPNFQMTKRQVAAEILFALGVEGIADTAALTGDDSLVINIVPIEAEVVELMDGGTDEETAMAIIADKWSEKIYKEEKAKNQEFNIPEEVIAVKIMEMLWEMKIDDIEGYESPDAGRAGIREATALSPLNDENPASEI